MPGLRLLGRRRQEGHQKEKRGEFPGSPVVRNPCFHGKGKGSIPGWGTRILHATWRGKKKKKRMMVKRTRAAGVGTG